jgi:tol-pal system protein YbgF
MRALLLAGVGLTVCVSALAQTAPNVEPRVAKLESEMRAVQRKVFPGGSPRFFEPEFPAATTTPGAVSTSTGGTDPKALADLQARLFELEKQLRDITGRVEQNENQTKQIEQKFAAFKTDVEARLGKIELASAPPVVEPVVSPVPIPAPPTKPAVSPATPTPAGSDAQYKAAYAFFEAKDYDRAETAFKEFIGRYGYKTDKDRGVPLSANAQYWLGRTHVNKKAYAQAARAFLEGYQRYPKADKAPDSLLGLAESLNALGKPADACSALSELQMVYPAASSDIKAKSQAAKVKAKCK